MTAGDDPSHYQFARGNIIKKALPQANNSKGIKIGIENLLVLDEIDMSSFYSAKETTSDYGEKRRIEVIDKMKLCKFVCENLEEERAKKVLINLKAEINSLLKLFK